jgi:hypothetical protein
MNHRSIVCIQYRSRCLYQCCGSVTFLYGLRSADPYLRLTDPDPDPASFVSDLQEVFLLITF